MNGNRHVKYFCLLLAICMVLVPRAIYFLKGEAFPLERNLALGFLTSLAVFLLYLLIKALSRKSN